MFELVVGTGLLAAGWFARKYFSEKKKRR